jgi:tryptophan-rich sensory protein
MQSIRNWYAGLHKPAFTPPDWVFGPIWTLLYLLMGIAAYAVWKRGLSNWQVRHALVMFIVQLALNIAWSVLFFGLHSVVAGLIDIALLWFAIMFTLFAFFKLSTTAGVLMMPYFLWVSFAMILNFSLWLLN